MKLPTLGIQGSSQKVGLGWVWRAFRLVCCFVGGVPLLVFLAAFRLVVFCFVGGCPVVSGWYPGGIRVVSGWYPVVSGALFGGIRYVGPFPFHVWLLLA